MFVSLLVCRLAAGGPERSAPRRCRQVGAEKAWTRRQEHYRRCVICQAIRAQAGRQDPDAAHDRERERAWLSFLPGARGSPRHGCPERLFFVLTDSDGRRPRPRATTTPAQLRPRPAEEIPDAPSSPACRPPPCLAWLLHVIVGARDRSFPPASSLIDEMTSTPDLRLDITGSWGMGTGPGRTI